MVRSSLFIYAQNEKWGTNCSCINEYASDNDCNKYIQGFYIYEKALFGLQTWFTGSKIINDLQKTLYRF